MIGIACVLGAVAGVALSLKRQNEAEKDLQATTDALDREVAAQAQQFPPAPMPELKNAQMSGPQVSPEAIEGLPIYPGSNPHDLAKAIKGQGNDMKIAWFTTPDSIDQVLSFYEQRFAQAHRLPIRHRYNVNAGYVGYLDVNNEKLHLITAIRNLHDTLVFPSSSYPGQFLQSEGKLPEGVPVLPRANGSVVIDFDEGHNARQSYFATVGDRTVAEVAEFYKLQFALNGWSIEEVNEVLATEVRIDARKGKGSCNVLVQKRDQKVAIYVSIAGQV